jgi:two-component system, NarL family, response regulator DesR
MTPGPRGWAAVTNVTESVHSTRARGARGERWQRADLSEIAGRLYLSEGTVRNYLSAAIGETGARNRIEAVRIAREKGWV